MFARPQNATNPTTKRNYCETMDDESTTKCNYPDHDMHDICEALNTNDKQKHENRNKHVSLM